MTSVTFDLPLNPRHVFTQSALSQLAEQIVGTSISLGAETVGTVKGAEVVGDRVRARAEVDDDVARMVGGYGLDVSIVGEPCAVERVEQARVEALPPSLMPPASS